MKLLSPEQYQPKAHLLFQALRRQLEPLLPHHGIEHIGASAIPAAISKGDLDICIITPNGQLADTITIIKTLGYREKEDTLRTDQLCMLIPQSGNNDVALQIIEAGSQFEFFLTFRNALRANPSWVVDYNQVKQAAASLSEEEYRHKKADFIDSILRRWPPNALPLHRSTS